jgi:hypothetical protein
MMAKVFRVDWQDVSAYTRIVNMDRSLLMWEWLKRDPSYQEFYIGKPRDLTRLPSGVKVIRLADDVACTFWGLHFRRSP